MTFQQNLARYVIGDIGSRSLPGIALAALEEGLDSPSLRILAGLRDDDLMIDDYFRETLKELSVELPDKKQAAIEVALVFAEEIFDGKRPVFEGVQEICNTLDAYPSESRRYCYDSISFEKVYGWFDTIDELQYARHRWDAVKTNEELALEARKELMNELKIWANKMRERI